MSGISKLKYTQDFWLRCYELLDGVKKCGKCGARPSAAIKKVKGDRGYPEIRVRLGLRDKNPDNLTPENVILVCTTCQPDREDKIKAPSMKEIQKCMGSLFE